ncbi:MAG TPA: serine hydrolase [Thermoanaerobaculia bacterium]|nr:serine hydrolase [Thermoanaerobaculia bacterium]
MKTTIRMHWVVCIALTATAAQSEARAQSTPSQVAGYRAGITCSAVFLGGRNPLDVLREELDGLQPANVLVEAPVVDYHHRTASVRYEAAPAPRLAVAVPGFGCVLLPPGERIEDAAKLPHHRVGALPAQTEAAANSTPWPAGDLSSSDPLPPEVDDAKLAAVLDSAFGGPGSARHGAHQTLGVVVVYDDRIVAERYAPGWDMHTQYRTWSSAKSLASALVGILVGEGKLRIDQPAPVPAWQSQDDPRREITLEHLLHMSSGLASTGSDTPEGYWGGIDTAEDIQRLDLEAPPGTVWKYSNYDTLLLVLAMREVIGDTSRYLSFPRRALLDRIGMRHTFPETDAFGNFVLSSQVYTTVRDLARFGLLYLHDGVWLGERILPEGWVEYTRQPAPARKPETDVEWGYAKQFWLFDRDSRVPPDTYTTAGHRGQHATIVPSRRVVIARTGLDPRTGAGWDQAQFVADVLAAIASPVDGSTR